MTEFIRVFREGTLVGQIVLDPYYDPPRSANELRQPHDPECRDNACALCRDITGPLVDYELVQDARQSPHD